MSVRQPPPTLSVHPLKPVSNSFTLPATLEFGVVASPSAHGYLRQCATYVLFITHVNPSRYARQTYAKKYIIEPTLVMLNSRPMYLWVRGHTPWRWPVESYTSVIRSTCWHVASSGTQTSYDICCGPARCLIAVAAIVALSYPLSFGRIVVFFVDRIRIRRP